MKIKKIVAFTIVILVVFTISAFSQFNYWYHGKNKVREQQFNWKTIETSHFNIYYYVDDKQLINKVARAAERSFVEIGDYLNLEISEKIPLIFYTTHIDLEQTNILPYIPPGAIAFSEPMAKRVVIQGDASFDDLSATIAHELGHVFQFEVLGSQVFRQSAPLWTAEGFCDFVTKKWDSFNLLTVRDSVLNDRMPQLLKNGDLRSQYDTGRTPYDFGHLAYDFIDKKFGQRGVKKFVFSLKQGRRLGGLRNIFGPFDFSNKLFNYQFSQYAKERFKQFITKESPEDYSYSIGPEFPFFYTFSHQISPTGELMAVVTASQRTSTLEIVLVSMNDGKVIKTVTPGFTSKYDNINFNFNPERGQSFSWNHGSDQIGFFARKELKNYLVLIDILKNDILKKIEIIDVQEPTSPVFHPKNNRLYFTGIQSARSYLFSVDLETDQIVRHSKGKLFIQSIDIAADGNKLVYSAKDQSNHYKLFLATLDSPEQSRRLTDGLYNDITPVFSRDSKTIYYSSDELQSYNINSIDLESKTLRRFTDVKTGNFYPLELPGDEKKVVLSSYYKNTFNIYKKDISEAQEVRQISFSEIGTASDEVIAADKIEEEKDADLRILSREDYRPLSKLYLTSLPPAAFSLGTDGSIWGFTYLDMGDLMGDHRFNFLISSQFGYRSYQFTYLNMERRAQLYTRLYYFTDAYYPWYSDPYGTGAYNSGNYKTFRRMLGGEAGLFFPFSRSTRLEATVGFYRQEEDSDILFYGLELPYGQFFNGMAMPLTIALVNETTRFANYGPNQGYTFRLEASKYIKLGDNYQDAWTFQGDVRKYFRLDNYSLFAFRLHGFHSTGDNASLIGAGGNNTIRSAGYYQMVGTNLFYFNAEFRFPLINLAATPLGLFGPLRGVLFFDLGGAWFKGQQFRMFEEGKFRLQDAVASYGWGLEFFLAGYPMHVEWIWRWDLDQTQYMGVNFWIGFSF